jgi:diguanylate cyclase (GGDEF)-like protein/PAS domain S-box-containing protein
MLRILPSPRRVLSPGLGTAVAILIYGGTTGAGLFLQHALHLPYPPLYPELGILLGLLLRWQVHTSLVLAAIFVFDDVILAWGAALPPSLAALDSFSRVATLTLAVSLLAPRFRSRPDSSRPSRLVQVLTVVVLTPFFPTLLAADGAYFLHHVPYLSFWLNLYLETVNSLFLFALPFLAASSPSLPASPTFSLAGGVRAYTILVLTLTIELLFPRYPLRFLVFPCLILVAARRPFFETTLAVLFWSLFEIGRAILGSEAPFAISVHSLFERNVVTQIFVFAYGASALGFAASFGQLRRLQALHARSLKRLRESEQRFRELAAHSRDAIFRIGPDARRIYVSPAVTELFGFTPEEQIGRDWRDDVHPDDWPSVKPVLRAFLRGDADNTAFSYRRRCKNGAYVWVETRVRRVRDPETGETREFVANTRDISAQKAAEAELTAANAQLSTLVMTDGLTGVANRRAFDRALPLEWARARRDGTPLGLLVIDIDHFKSFNDFYGHLAGDECLRTLARVLRGVAHRMADLPARYGGEEFVLLLPGADLAACRAIAERIRERLAEADISNEIVPSGRLTVSIGIAAEEPGRPHESASALFAAADRALYAAKRWGRDQVVSEDDPRLSTLDTEAPSRLPSARPASPSLNGAPPSSLEERASPAFSPDFADTAARPPLSRSGAEELDPLSPVESSRAEDGENGAAASVQVTAKTS